MKALVKFGQQPGNVELRDVPTPEIGPHDVLLRTASVGLCGWDIEMWQHKMATPVKVPVIQGHEFCGTVEAVGDNVKDFRQGDRVVSETAAEICGSCPECRTGNYHLCADRKGFGYGTDGAFTDYVRVAERCLHRLPDNVPFNHACLTEPACVAYNALVINSDVRPGEPVLIIGPGPIGLFSLQVAKACGAGPIVIVGTPKDTVRFEAARALGADRIIDVGAEDAAQAVSEMTEGRGVPLVVDAAGNEKALALAIDAVARRGQITKIGWGPDPINLSLDPLLSKSARLQGTFSHTWPTWEAVIAMISQGTIQMPPVISHTVCLDDWLPTFEAIHECQGIKAVFEIDKE